VHCHDAGTLTLNTGRPATDASRHHTLCPVKFFFEFFLSNLRIVWMKIEYDRVILDKI
jgi:hypothetical protein